MGIQVMGVGKMRAEYTVKAVPWKRGHVLYILGEGVTQTSDEEPDVSADAMVRDYLECVFERSATDVRLTIDYVNSWTEEDDRRACVECNGTGPDSN